MATSIPVISITKEQDNQEDISSDESQDGAYGNEDFVTDVEDFDDESCNIVKSLKKVIKKISPGVTDVEDYNDSDSEDNNKNIVDAPDIKLSLEEFLEQTVIEESTEMANGNVTCNIQNNKSNITNIPKFALFNPMEDDFGMITDCEDVNTSNDEAEFEDPIPSIDLDITQFLPESDTVDISDKIRRQLKKKVKRIRRKVAAIRRQSVNDADIPSDVSDSDVGAASCDDVSDAASIASVAENFAISDANESNSTEEETTPTIDIKFVVDGKVCKKNQFLTVNKATTSNEPVTDVEKLDSSVDSSSEEEDNHMPIPKTRLSVLSNAGSVTDIENLDLGDTSDLLAEIKNVSFKSIPSPTREIIIVKEDEEGRPVASVMPLDTSNEKMNLGIQDNYADKGQTDTEEFSGVEEDYYEEFNVTCSQIPDYDADVVQNVESVKLIGGKKRSDVNDVEPITDTEDLVLKSATRRKKPKAKSVTKAKRFLEPQAVSNLVSTDIEEMDLSDSNLQNVNNKDHLKVQDINSHLGSQTPDMKTDVEDMSADDDDDDDYVSDADQKSDTSLLEKQIFCSTVTSIESISNAGVIPKRVRTPQAHVTCDSADPQSQCPTDVEDVQLPSDAEDGAYQDTYSTADTASPKEFQEALNDGSVSIVHEKCGSSFNIDNEKNYIKGLKDITEAHTDVEYIEDDENKADAEIGADNAK